MTLWIQPNIKNVPCESIYFFSYYNILDNISIFYIFISYKDIKYLYFILYASSILQHTLPEKLENIWVKYKEQMMGDGKNIYRVLM